MVFGRLQFNRISLATIPYNSYQYNIYTDIIPLMNICFWFILRALSKIPECMFMEIKWKKWRSHLASMERAKDFFGYSLWYCSQIIESTPLHECRHRKSRLCRPFFLFFLQIIENHRAGWSDVIVGSGALICRKKNGFIIVTVYYDCVLLLLL